MEKVDRVVALVGALVLVAAVGVAATQGAAGAQEYVLSYAVAETGEQMSTGPAALPSSGGTFELPLEVDAANVSKVNVTFTFRAVNAQGGSVRVVLKAPNGTIMAEEEQALGAASPGSSLVYGTTLEAVLGPLPGEARGTYASPEEARAALVHGSPEAVGTWLGELTFASGAAPAIQVQVTLDGRVLGWNGRAEPVAPESR